MDERALAAAAADAPLPRPPPGHPRVESIADEWRAWWPSRMVWWWAGKLMMKGYRQPLELEDVGVVDFKDEAALNADRLSLALARRARKRGVGAKLTGWDFAVALGSIETGSLLASGLCKLIGDLLGFVGPLAISGIVQYVTAKATGVQPAEWRGLALGVWWLIAVFVAGIIQNFLLQHHHEIVMHAGVRCRSAVTLLVYKKSMSTTGDVRRETGNGKIANMQSSDANTLGLCWWFIHYTWAAPLQVCHVAVCCPHSSFTAARVANSYRPCG